MTRPGEMTDAQLIHWAKLLTGTAAESTIDVAYWEPSTIPAGRLARLAALAGKARESVKQRDDALGQVVLCQGCCESGLFCQGCGGQLL